MLRELPGQLHQAANCSEYQIVARTVVWSWLVAASSKIGEANATVIKAYWEEYHKEEVEDSCESVLHCRIEKPTTASSRRSPCQSEMRTGFVHGNMSDLV